jgi:hypothetical protein
MPRKLINTSARSIITTGRYSPVEELASSPDLWMPLSLYQSIWLTDAVFLIFLQFGSVGSILDTYEKRYDARFPVVCMDEQPAQSIGETRIAVPVGPGRPQRCDHQYRRNGTAVNLMFTVPLAGFEKSRHPSQQDHGRLAPGDSDIVGS